jgi:hypothetical protein
MKVKKNCSINVSAGLRYININEYAKRFAKLSIWVRVKINDEHFYPVCRRV